MTGSKITLEGREIVYLPAGAVLTEAEQRAVGYDVMDDALLREHPRARRVLGTLVRADPKFFQALHWTDGPDLLALDVSIQSGQVDERDFAGALLVEAGTVQCTACGEASRVLTVDAGQVLFASTLAERLRRHDLVTACPRCHERWTVLAVEVLE